MSVDARFGEISSSGQGTLDGHTLSTRMFGEAGMLSRPLAFSPLYSRIGADVTATVPGQPRQSLAGTPEAGRLVSDMYLRQLIQYIQGDDPKSLIPPDWSDLIHQQPRFPTDGLPNPTGRLRRPTDAEFNRLRWPGEAQDRPNQPPASTYAGGEHPGPLTNQVPDINIALVPGQAPTWSAEALNQKLAGTPMAGLGAFIYDEAVKYGIDDRIPMIIASNESAFGRSSLGQRNHNPFGMRARSGWQRFDDYQGAIDKWFRLVKTYPTTYGSRTYAEMMQHYAPSSDGNNFRQLVANGSVLVAQVNQIEAANRAGDTTAVA